MIYVGITRRSDSGKWRCFWTVNGKRKVSGDCNTEAEAIGLQQTLKQQLNPEIYTGAIHSNWEHVAKKYVEDKELRLSDSGSDEIKRTLAKFEYIIKPESPQTVRPDDIQKFIKYRLHKDGVVEQTVNKDLTNLITFFNWCVRKKFLAMSPDIEKLSTEDKDVFVMTDEECTTLLKTAKAISDKFYRIVKLGLVTGQRINDILTLSITQCNFHKNIIVFKPKKTKKHGKRKIEVPIKKKYMDEIATWFDDGRRWLFFETDPSGKNTSLLFYGKEMDDFRDMFKTAEIDLPKGTLTHVFRHTAATRLARISVPLAMKITGHKDATMFMKKYVNPVSVDLRQAQDSLDLE